MNIKRCDICDMPMSRAETGATWGAGGWCDLKIGCDGIDKAVHKEICSSCREKITEYIETLTSRKGADW